MQQTANRLTFIGLDLSTSPAARAQLERLAAVSGGRFVPADDPAQLSSIIVAAVTPSVGGGGGGGVLPAETNVVGPAIGFAAVVLVNAALLLAIVRLRRSR